MGGGVYASAMVFALADCSKPLGFNEASYGQRAMECSNIMSSK
jgi:hypothetical protein